MGKRLLFFIIVIAVSIIGVVIFGRKDYSSPESKQISPADADVVVTVNKDNFSPELITINKGDTVVWVNKGDGYYWPASNLHPTHKIYEEFDPKSPISPGESWSFTFERAGMWKYHDHLWPSNVGEVTVRE